MNTDSQNENTSTATVPQVQQVEDAHARELALAKRAIEYTLRSCSLSLSKNVSSNIIAKMTDAEILDEAARMRTAIESQSPRKRALFQKFFGAGS